MRITSYGAADGVTGSCHLLEIDDRQILLDCGLFQGRGAHKLNAPPLPFDPRKIDALLVTHAHLDHIGRVPMLHQEGFDAKIISTRPTFDLARINLMDSARLMDADITRANRKRGPDQAARQPLFDEQDVFTACELWRDHVVYGQLVQVCEGVQAIFHDAGHILGSAFIELRLTPRDGEPMIFIFSGDLGNLDKPIIRDPAMPPRADAIMLESTYGGRDHRPFAASVKELEAVICDTFTRGGNVIIPAFALERSQELLYVLHAAWRDGRIPRDTQIFLDSPMAIDATRVFEASKGFYDEDALALLRQGISPFHFPALNYTRHTVDSMRINQIRQGAVILAGSGMCTGGRVIHHLRQHLHRPESAVVFCGYQSVGTLGREIVSGAQEVRLDGSLARVRAQIHTINGFSGHAGQTTLTRWAEASGASQVLLVHGEDDAKDALREHLSARNPQMRISAPAAGSPLALGAAPR